MSGLEQYLETNYLSEEQSKRKPRKRRASQDWIEQNEPSGDSFSVEKADATITIEGNSDDGWKAVDGPQIVNKKEKEDSEDKETEDIPTKEEISVQNAKNQNLDSTDSIKTESKRDPSTSESELPLVKSTNYITNLPKGPARKRQKKDNLKQGPVYRDKYGRKLSNQKHLTLQQQRKQNALQRDQRIAELNRDEYTERLNTMEKELLNTQDVDKAHVDSTAIREEDPALMFNKSLKEQYDNVEYREKYLSICGRKSFKDKLLYPMNRFGLVPGARWDGVDRGNGYEKKWLQRQMEKTHDMASKSVITNEDD